MKKNGEAEATRDGLVEVVMYSTGRTREQADHVVRVILESSGVRDVEQFVSALRVLQAPEIGLYGNGLVEFFYNAALIAKTATGRALLREVFQRLMLLDSGSGPAQ